ncbi:hypothetical protein DFH08DRAFT_953224 [Mycena albidolilacea]|uniref:Uncharacterized protein n=1 Tax=Mycena albidolilacea TaxID=1033008 RepID=A0AAD7AGF5_9AGAR|nr:hypothetical protein DFH08DRAFT_953224 [Mycena albidolilacea]
MRTTRHHAATWLTPGARECSAHFVHLTAPGLAWSGTLFICRLPAPSLGEGPMLQSCRTLPPLPLCAHNCGSGEHCVLSRCLVSHLTPTRHLAVVDCIRSGAVCTAKEGAASQRATVSVRSPRLSAHTIDPSLEVVTELTPCTCARVCTIHTHAQRAHHP